MKSSHKIAPKMIASRAISTEIVTTEEEQNISTSSSSTISRSQVIKRDDHPPSLSSLFKKFFPSPISTLGIVLIGTYSIFSLNAQIAHSETEISAISDQISNQPKLLALKSDEEVIPQENSLYIPKLDVLTEISEGEYEDEKKYTKAWRRSHTSTPEEGGNTVVVGHRYRDNLPDYPLYDIDQISEGDELVLYWNQKKYAYTVQKTLEVHETAIEIEDETENEILTLYACDWSGKNRLVVQALLQEE